MCWFLSTSTVLGKRLVRILHNLTYRKFATFSAISDVKKHVTRMKIRIIVVQMAESLKLTCV